MTSEAMQHPPNTDGNKPDSYYANDRLEMLQYFPAQPGRVLDVGCSNGRFGAMIKDRLPAAEVWGVEPVLEAQQAAVKVLDKVHHGLFDDALNLPASHFDIVCFNDSLEHFPNSAPPLVLAKRLLKPEGRLIASIPNVRYWPHLKKYLFQGDWRYEDEGILDRTHMRFFTKSSIAHTLDESGFKVIRIEGINPCWRGNRLAVSKLLLPAGMQDIMYLQFAVVALKKDGP